MFLPSCTQHLHIAGIWKAAGRPRAVAALGCRGCSAGTDAGCSYEPRKALGTRTLASPDCSPHLPPDTGRKRMDILKAPLSIFPRSLRISLMAHADPAPRAERCGSALASPIPAAPGSPSSHPVPCWGALHQLPSSPLQVQVSLLPTSCDARGRYFQS